MKLFSKLMLALSLITGSAHTIVPDLYNLRNLPEAPTDTQDRLAWGLLKLNKSIIVEALEAGADANKVYSDVDGVINAYNILSQGAQDKGCEEHLQIDKIPTYLENSDALSCVNLIAHNAAFIREFYEIAAFLVSKNVSVDTPFYVPFHADTTLRKFVQEIIEDIEGYIATDIEYNEPVYEMEYKRQIIFMLKSFQEVIEKYQAVEKV